MSDTGRNDTPGVLAPPPVLIAGTMVLGFLVQRVWPLRVFPKSLDAVRRPLGVAITVAGVAGAAWANVTMLRAGTHPDPGRPDTELVEHGPFQFSRNPGYLTGFITCTGIAIWRNALWPLLLLPLLFLVMREKVVRREEVHLERQFGNAYRDYRVRVRRWV